MDDAEKSLFEGARELLKQQASLIMKTAQEHGAGSISVDALARIVLAIDVLDRRLMPPVILSQHGLNAFEVSNEPGAVTFIPPRF